MPARKRILLINDKYGEFGGTEQYINSFAALFTPLGYEVSVAYGMKFPDGFSNPLIREFHLPFLAQRENRASPSQLKALFRCVEEVQPELVYVHNIFEHRLITSLKERYPACPLVWYAHDHYFYCLTELKMLDGPAYASCELPLGSECETNILKGRCVKKYPLPADLRALLAERQQLLRAARLFDRIVVISPYMAATLLKNDRQLEHAITLVPRQVDIPSLANGGRSGNTVLYSGRVVKEKGVEYLINAMGLIGGDGPILLQVVGGGDDPAYIAHCEGLAEQTAALRRGLSIEFIGHKPQPEVSHYYEAASVVAIPSLWPEPLGSVALEALARAVPVVAFDVGGLRTVVKDGETGLLARAADVRDLSHKIALLLGDRSLATELGAKGRAFVERNFHHRLHIEAMERIFDELSARREAAPLGEA